MRPTEQTANAERYGKGGVSVLPKNTMILRMAAIGCVLGVGIGSFVLTRALLPKTPVAEATQASVFQADEVSELLKMEESKVPFSGEMNGITFKNQVEAKDFGVPGCLPTDASEDQILASPLKVAAGYLPKELKEDNTFASSCDDRLISFAVTYHGPEASITISRFASKTVASDAPEERMTPAKVSGKSAVLITGLPAVGSPRDGSVFPQRLIVLEEFGVTQILASGLTEDELIKIAEGVK